MGSATQPSVDVGERVYRHSLTTRVTHALWALAMLVLVMSGLQIFNAAPYLDAAQKSDPTHRVLSFEAHRDTQSGIPVGTTTVLGHTFVTTGIFGWTDDGQGGKAFRAFPAVLTLPGPQDLADGRRWHLFFAWILALAIGGYIVGAAVRGDLGALVLRRSDVAKLLPMQLYYLRLRPSPPPHGTYNPLQKAAYTAVLFVLFPLVIASGLALSPAVDALVPWLPALFGGRQFARLWHFVFMVSFVGYFAMHMTLVLVTGVRNNVASMITGWYRLGEHDGIGP